MNAAQPQGAFARDPDWSIEALIDESQRFMALPDRPIDTRFDIVTIEAGGLAWDIAGAICQPSLPEDRMIGPDGRAVGFFLIHGGEGDYRSMQGLAQLLARKCGVRVVSMTYPGRFAFDDPAHDWHGDTIRPDGSVRTPVWQRGERIGRDEYEVLTDGTNRAVYGTRTLARALPGSRFHRRMAGWPLAMEEGALALMARHFPPADWSVLVHGHSTGGPVSHYLLQRVCNIKGLAGIENSQFGYIWAQMNGAPWPNGFEDLVIRTWRDQARYIGAEALKSRGPEALMALPALIEDVFAAWQGALHEPQFKAEYILHVNCERELERAARTTAEAMGLDAQATAVLVQRYLGYGRPLAGPDAPPLPPIIYIVCALSRDHTPERYRQIAIPMMEAIVPKPRIRLFTFGAGTHYYFRPAPGLPEGLCPAAISIWMDALRSGYFDGEPA
jgi:hypothetical protein